MITALIDLLGSYYQSGDITQMMSIAHGMLEAIPDDLVALQFLGLALYQLGRFDRAHRIFQRVAKNSANETTGDLPTTCETAAHSSYREAMRPSSQLADAWQKIALILREYGFDRPAERALSAARAARCQGASQPACLNAAE